MSDTAIARILSREELLRLVQLTWDSVAVNASEVPLGDAHRAVIDERVAEDEANPDDVGRWMEWCSLPSDTAWCNADCSPSKPQGHRLRTKPEIPDGNCTPRSDGRKNRWASWIG